MHKAGRSDGQGGAGNQLEALVERFLQRCFQQAPHGCYCYCCIAVSLLRALHEPGGFYQHAQAHCWLAERQASLKVICAAEHMPVAACR